MLALQESTSGLSEEQLLRHIVRYNLPILRLAPLRRYLTGLTEAELPPLRLVAATTSAELLSRSQWRYFRSSDTLHNLVDVCQHDLFLSKDALHDLDATTDRAHRNVDHRLLDTGDREQLATLHITLLLKGGSDVHTYMDTVEEEVLHQWMYNTVLALGLPWIQLCDIRPATSSELTDARARTITCSYTRILPAHVEAMSRVNPPPLGSDFPTPDSMRFRIPAQQWIAMYRHPLPHALFGRMRVIMNFAAPRLEFADLALYSAFTHLLQRLYLDAGVAPGRVLPRFSQLHPSALTVDLIRLMRHHSSYQLAAVVLGVPSLLQLFGLHTKAHIDEGRVRAPGLNTIFALAGGDEATDADTRAALGADECEQAFPHAEYQVLPSLVSDMPGPPLDSDSVSAMYPVLPDPADWLEAFHARTGNLLRHLDWSRFMVAGGLPLAVLLSLQPASSSSPLRSAAAHFRSSDIDLFPIDEPLEGTMETPLRWEHQVRQAVNTVLQAIYRTLQEERKSTSVLLLHSANAVSIVVSGYPLLQLIMRRSPTPDDVLLNFDLDCVGIGFHAGKLYVSGRCMRSLRTATNEFDPAYAAPPYFQRLQKYRRRGFAVAVRGLAACTFGGDERGYFARMLAASPASTPLDSTSDAAASASASASAASPLTGAAADAATTLEPSNNYDCTGLITPALLAGGLAAVRAGLAARMRQAVEAQVQADSYSSGDEDPLYLSFLFCTVDLAHLARPAGVDGAGAWSEARFESMLPIMCRNWGHDEQPTAQEVFEGCGVEWPAEEEQEPCEAYTVVNVRTEWGRRSLRWNEGRFRGVRPRDDWYLLHQLHAQLSPAKLLHSDAPLLRPHTHVTQLSLWDAMPLGASIYRHANIEAGLSEWQPASTATSGSAEMQQLDAALEHYRSLYITAERVWPLAAKLKTLLLPLSEVTHYPQLCRTVEQAKADMGTKLRALLDAYPAEEDVLTPLRGAVAAARHAYLAAADALLVNVAALQTRSRALTTCHAEIAQCLRHPHSLCPVRDMCWQAEQSAWSGLGVGSDTERAISGMLQLPSGSMVPPLEMPLLYLIASIAQQASKLQERDEAVLDKLLETVQEAQMLSELQGLSAQSESESDGPGPSDVTPASAAATAAAVSQGAADAAAGSDPPSQFWAIASANGTALSFLQAAARLCSDRVHMSSVRVEHVLGACALWSELRLHWLRAEWHTVQATDDELHRLHREVTQTRLRVQAELRAETELEDLLPSYDAAFEQQLEFNDRLYSLHSRIKTRRASPAQIAEHAALLQTRVHANRALRRSQQRLTELVLVLPEVMRRVPMLFGELGERASSLIVYSNVEADFLRRPMPQRAGLFQARRRPAEDERDTEEGEPDEAASEPTCVLKQYSTASEQELMSRSIKLLQDVHHPCVLPLEAIIRDEDAQCWYLQFPFCTGGTLRDWLNRASRRHRKSLMRQLLGTLAYLHGRNIAHRDIKPENVLVSEDGQINLCDFDFTSEQHSHSTVLLGIGTLGYRDPTVQLNEAQNNTRSDIFALGVIMHEMWAGGKPPFPFPSRAPDSASDSLLKLWPLLARMLSPQQDGRPTAAQLLADDFFASNEEEAEEEEDAVAVRSRRFEECTQQLRVLQTQEARKPEIELRFVRAPLPGSADVAVPLPRVLRLLVSLPAERFERQFRMTFEGEDGIDAGGLRKEFWAGVWAQLLGEHQGIKPTLFECDEDRGVYLPAAGADCELLHLVGRLMAKSVLSGCFVSCASRFSRVLFKFALDPQVRVDHADYQQYTSAYSGLVHMSPQEVADAGFSFLDLRTHTERAGGNGATETRSESAAAAAAAVSPQSPASVRAAGASATATPGPTAALSPGSTGVNRSNYRSFIKQKMQFDLIESRRPQLQALCAGLLSEPTLRSVLLQCGSPSAMQMLLGGPTTLTADDIISCLIFRPADPLLAEQLNAWLRDQSAETLTKFLLFVTALPQLPFSNGLSLSEDERRAIKVIRIDVDGPAAQASLPVAHTCFRMIDLPAYNDPDVLASKLHTAIHAGNTFALS